ncbi:hypothetical protein [Radiobacillus sp. PE A8.2]|uniref:hypothetical protein n=1 Tax=Radiobacillus sp. PE A8.2 TaxID=3380349 RepID=UPI00388D7206
MSILMESMQFPIDNLLGLFLYALLFTLIPGVIVSLTFRFIPKRLPYMLQNVVVAVSVYLGIILWWHFIVR